MLHYVVVIGCRLSRVGHFVASFPWDDVANNTADTFSSIAYGGNYLDGDLTHYMSCIVVQLLLHVALMA